jgi:hypothetical protein
MSYGLNMSHGLNMRGRIQDFRRGEVRSKVCYFVDGIASTQSYTINVGGIIV